MSSPTRWAGVLLTDRRAERRELLVAAAFALFGDGGEAAVSLRSVCRQCGLNTRYFYESFSSVDELLGAVYDNVNLELSQAVEAAMAGSGDSIHARTHAGIVAVLQFSSVDPRRGRILFTDARTNAVLTERRSATRALLLELVVVEGAATIQTPIPWLPASERPCTQARWSSSPSSGSRARSAPTSTPSSTTR